ncbi:hypothetical protein DL96DRAFT_1713814 [Flagelloscypha sp. PMI_526]|nr:hypothetical protein DL96DRAFT_1713814 [Flagelloscypha sp. PMI_526]
MRASPPGLKTWTSRILGSKASDNIGDSEIHESKAFDNLDDSDNETKASCPVDETLAYPPVNATPAFPPLPIDVMRTVCESAAELDKTTAASLCTSSRDLRLWVTPILFRRLVIRSYESLLLLKSSGMLERISSYVYSVSLQPRSGDLDHPSANLSRTAMEFKNFLKDLPNLVHFRWPLPPVPSRWGYVSIVLPACVSSLEIAGDLLLPLPLSGFHHLGERVRFESLARAQVHVTHIYSNLTKTIGFSFFTRWSAITHVFFGIRPERAGDSIATSTFPTSHPSFSLPDSIVSCILMDSLSSAQLFRWAIDRALVDLVLGDLDSRIVFCAGGTRKRWMKMRNKPGLIMEITPAVDLSWIRVGLQDAILYYNPLRPRYETIWEDAEVVRERRRTHRVRKSVYRLLRPRSEEIQ